MKNPRVFSPLLLSVVVIAAALLGAPSWARAESGGLPAVPKDKLHLFLLAGQSNMAGRGAVKDLSDEAGQPHPRVWALNREGGWQPAMDPLHWDKPAAGVGVGKFFGRLVADARPDVTVGLIPSACGGSKIMDWREGAFFSQTKTHPWDDAIARTRNAMRAGTLKAILWHQGEGDSNPTDASLYEERLEALIRNFRAEFGDAELPFIIGQLGRFERAPWNEHRVEVDRAQRSVAAKMKNVYFVSIEDATSKDRLHFDTASLERLAAAYAEAYLQASAK